MGVLYIRNYFFNRFDREMFLKEYLSFRLMIGMMKRCARYVRPGIKPLDIHCQAQMGYLHKGSPRIPRPSPKGVSKRIR